MRCTFRRAVELSSFVGKSLVVGESPLSLVGTEITTFVSPSFWLLLLPFAGWAGSRILLYTVHGTVEKTK